MSEPTYCEVRGMHCRCGDYGPTCDSRAPAGPFSFRMKCDHCKTQSEMYEALPHCRECADVVCLDCGTDYDAESGRITCRRCTQATWEERHAEQEPL